MNSIEAERKTRRWWYCNDHITTATYTSVFFYHTVLFLGLLVTAIHEPAQVESAVSNSPMIYTDLGSNPSSRIDLLIKYLPAY